MIAYEIQLRYVIRDKIQSETKSSPRKNPRKIFVCWKKNFQKKYLSQMLSWISSAQSELSRDKSMLNPH